MVVMMLPIRRDWCEEHNRGSLATTDGLCPECEARSTQRGHRSATQPEDRDARLKEPKTKMAILVRRLAERAMSVTHHDAADWEPEYIHEVQEMERQFTRILRGKLRS